MIGDDEEPTNEWNLYYQGKCVKDDERPATESGYQLPFKGDAGSPYWILSEDKNVVKRATLVAIVEGLDRTDTTKGLYLFTEPATVTDDPVYQCRTIATKLTKEIVNWVKERSDIE